MTNRKKNAYQIAIERAVLEMARSISDPSRGEEAGAEAFLAAVRAYVGDPSATAFSVGAVERVRRDVIIAFGDGFSGRIRCKVEQRLGTEVAEVAERIIVDDVAELLRMPLTGETDK
jgi:hypothetical protein